MHFAFTDDQLAFASATRDLLSKACGPEAVRAAWDDGPGYDPALWAQLGEMGVLGVLAPEAAGGLGLTDVDFVLIAEEAGRAALPGPLIEHAAVAVPALAQAGPMAEAWLGKAVTGEALLTVAHMDRHLVPWGAEADLVVVVGGTVAAVERARITDVRPRKSAEGSRRLAEISWSGAVPLGGVDARMLAARGTVMTAAQLCGLAAHLIDSTAEYVRQRHQFGVPVGSFQAVKHHLSNALIALEHARPAVYAAAWAIASSTPDRDRDASFAKVYANEAAGTAARVALQCHGAIGYTIEHDLHLWLKRVWSLQRAWGDSDLHRRRVAEAVVAPR